MKKVAIILGTARENGNTADLTSSVAKKTDAKVFDINKYNILPFDYEYKNQDDDFLSLIKEILTYDVIILASPVYWFSPSSSMKLFLDRLTDLLTIEKDLGRQLRGKLAGLISTGDEEKPKSCFEEIFKHTFEYLGMEYKGMIYCSVPFVESSENIGSGFNLNENMKEIIRFSDSIVN